MNTQTKPCLEEASQRNPAIAPERVREMQRVVKQLQDRGLLIPTRYGIQPALGGPTGELQAFCSIGIANRSDKPAGPTS